MAIGLIKKRLREVSVQCSLPVRVSATLYRVAKVSHLVKPITVSSWRQLRELFIDQPGWIFRGQQRASWPLATSLERAIPHGRVLTEGDLRFKFSQAIDNYLPVGQRPECLLDWLAAMQHHGTPTRLLDFTRSPYVAVYFAIEDANVDEPCAVWAINEPWCGARAGATLVASGAIRSPEGLFSWIYESPWPWTEAAMVVPAGVRKASARQIAQQAVFLFPGSAEHSFEQNLQAMAKSDSELAENIRCFVIPPRMRAEILHDLRLMNISRASLFPGLDGFAQSLKYSLVQEDARSISSRLALKALFEVAQGFDLSEDERSRTVMETMDGHGSLWLDGEELLPKVGYRITVERRPGGLSRVIGKLDIDPVHVGLGLMTHPGMASPNAGLVLRMEGGRVWHCVLKNNSGDLLNSGGFDPEI